MIALRHFVLACVAMACSLTSAAGQDADSVVRDKARAVSERIQQEPIIFSLAKGEPNSCGPGCSEWIAAEGLIDTGAPRRLRALLAGMAKGQLPIFFHSPGGFRGPAMEIGRLLREREMAAGVSRTLPGSCTAVGDNDCRTLKQLHNVAECSSACVYALIGAETRQVPPGSRIGVHSGMSVRLDIDGHYKAISNAQLGRYLREMKIDDGLLDVVSRVPHERMHYLSREEIADFGIDTSEFRETRWTAMEWPYNTVDWPPKRVSVLKFVVERKEQRKGYRTTVIGLSCGRPGGVGLGYFRRLMSDEVGGARSIELVADRSKLSLPKEPSISKLDAIESGGSFETRFTYDASAFLALAATRDSIDVIESGPTDAATSPRIIQLSTNGLSTALEQLNKRCRDREVLDAPGIRFLDPREAPAAKVIDVPGASGGR
jgi:hypothetical protein